MSRLENDSMGEIAVDDDRRWGAQTQRSLEHFKIGGDRFPREFLRALGLVKQACALANRELGTLAPATADAIAAVAADVAAGVFDDEFPLVVWQTGSGTQTNMNANEVIANVATEKLGARVHPNDDVNKSQSSNDVFPTAMHVATIESVHTRLLPPVRALRATLQQKSDAFADVVKIGRTHLQDAVPITLGQEISAWVHQLDQALANIEAALPPVRALAIGGTAVGTGLNAPPGFGDVVARHLTTLSGATSGQVFSSSDNKFAALSSHDPLVFLHGALKTLAVALTKIANDVRWLASGPRAGLAELTIPENEPGSSIMPGKVNPTQCEAVVMVAAQVMGNDVAVSIAGAGGSFQLNAMKPVIIHNVLSSIRLLGDASSSFDHHCAQGLEPDRARIADLTARSLMLVTALVPKLGYDRAAAIAKQAHKNGTTLKEEALAAGALTADELDALLRPETMTGKR